MSASMVGRVVSHYRILERLGGGGMGVVFKAEDTRLGRVVALKFLPLEWSDDQEWRQRFLTEARAASALDHPSICTIHDVGETDDGQCFICMGFYEGETLAKRLARAPLEPAEAVAIAIQTAEGLARAHEAGIVHRDVKPANLIVTRRGQVKILDFGLAKLSGSSAVTNPGAVVGTAGYMSPEQATGAEVDRRTDIWSLGAVLYEMLTGRRPFHGPSDPATMLAIVTQEPAPLGQLRPGLPAELERVVERAMTKARAQRYQRMEELVADLRALGWSAPLPESQPSLPPPRSAVPTGPPSQATISLGVRASRAAVRGRSGLAARVLAAVAALAGIAAVAWLGLRLAKAPRAGGAAEPGHRTIVVLPFENLGAAQDAYFAAGMTEEVTSRLTMVPGLGVISRTSAANSSLQGKTVRQIGEELRVEYVLEGSVRFDHPAEGASRVRITPRLVRVSDDTNLWSASYDRVLDDIFAVQSEIAGQVITQLGITLAPGQRQSLAAVPTANLEAYQAYLRGKELFRGPPALEGQDQAVAELERAVSLDPGFALAWAELARCHAYIFRVGHDRSPERRTAAERAIAEAVRLAPEAPEVHLAQAYFQYWVRLDLDRALAELAPAERGMPSSDEVVKVQGLILRRKGRYDEALPRLRQVAELSPRDADVAYDLGSTLLNLRRYPEAERWLKLSVSVAPEQLSGYINLIELYWVWQGSARATRPILERMPRSADPYAVHFWFLQHLYEGDLDAAMAMLQATPQEALDLVEFFEPRALLEGWAWRVRGDRERARSAFDKARLLLEAEVRERPDDPRFHSALGHAYAGLGRADEAVREAQRAVELMPVDRDAVVGPYHLAELALTCVEVGRYDDALTRVKQLLAIPAAFSLELVELDPRWAPLREQPGYRALRGR